MAQYLRDEFIKNLSITEETLNMINEFLVNRETTTNDALGDSKENISKKLLLTYVIRFDNRGYKLNDFNEIQKYYAQAKKVERVLFILDSSQSERSNRMYGTYFDIRLDYKDSNNCIVTAASDDGDSVNSVFNGIMDILNDCKNKNGWIRNAWTQLFVQIFGVAAGFIISLIAGIEISPHINIDNAFVIVFIFMFLIFSNAWNFINHQINTFLNYSFPNIRFIRQGKDSLHWLLQTVIGGLVVAMFLLLISQAFEWVGQIFGKFIQ